MDLDVDAEQSNDCYHRRNYLSKVAFDLGLLSTKKTSFHYSLVLADPRFGLRQAIPLQLWARRTSARLSENFLCTSSQTLASRGSENAVPSSRFSISR